MKSIAIAVAPNAPATAKVNSSTGAFSHTDAGWHDINWRKAHQNVRRLQVRIVKATQEKRWGKVKALQRLLTRSFSGKALAVKRVTENQGKRTPGVDGKTWSTPKAKMNGLRRMRQRGYRAQPLRRIHIPKSNGKGKRPLSIPTMFDRAMQALYLLALDPVAETTGDPNSYGFRKGRSTADAIEQCFNLLSRRHSAQWILEADIRSCFDTISHKWLETHIPLEKPVLQQWLKAGFIYNGTPFPTNEGVPQGGIISPVVANLALDGLEAVLRTHYPRTTKRGQAAKVNLARFADDFIITGSSYQLLNEEVKPLVEAFLQERGLVLSKNKTHITHIEQGFDFLGQNIRKYQGKLLIKPSTRNIQTFLKKVRAIIKANKTTKTGHLILQLNPVIGGWANFHRHVVSKQIYKQVDTQIFWVLWRWAKRRHPTRSTEWIRQKYFGASPQVKWALSDWVVGSQSQTRQVWLVRANNTAIRRHTKVRANANPYSPKWETYFEKRTDTKMVSALQGRDALRRLWLSQRGICPICNQKITKQTGWNNHHLVWRVYGGYDGVENRVLLHPNCHNQVHSQGLQVVKPRIPEYV
ncbi:MAG: group II intron reverse transcriptase/maturase [Ketobacter sp.]|nr:group II intron reverse transcriptase/maturase [Ketobacter sp.]